MLDQSIHKCSPQVIICYSWRARQYANKHIAPKFPLKYCGAREAQWTPTTQSFDDLYTKTTGKLVLEEILFILNSTEKENEIADFHAFPLGIASLTAHKKTVKTFLAPLILFVPRPNDSAIYRPVIHGGIFSLLRCFHKSHCPSMIALVLG